MLLTHELCRCSWQSFPTLQLFPRSPSPLPGFGSIQSLLQEQNFSESSRTTWFFPPNDANALQSLPAPNMLLSSLSSDQQLVFRQESLGSGRNASSPSLFIIQSVFALRAGAAAALEHSAPPEPPRTSQVLQGSVGF